MGSRSEVSEPFRGNRLLNGTSSVEGHRGDVFIRYGLTNATLGGPTIRRAFPRPLQCAVASFGAQPAQGVTTFQFTSFLLEPTRRKKQGAPNHGCSSNPDQEAPTNSTWPAPHFGALVQALLRWFKSFAAQVGRFRRSRTRRSRVVRLSVAAVNRPRLAWGRFSCCW